MRFWDLKYFLIIFVPLAVCFIIYFYIYLYKAYKLATYHYYGLISDEVYEEFLSSKLWTLKEMRAWQKKYKEVIRIAKAAKKNTQA